MKLITNLIPETTSLIIDGVFKYWKPLMSRLSQVYIVIQKYTTQ